MSRGEGGGRPSRYRVEFCQMAEEYIGSGHSTESLGSKFGVHKDTIYQWLKVYPKFSDAVKRGEARRADYIERMVATNAVTGNGNAASAIFLAKNWTALRDKQEVEHSGKISLVDFLQNGKRK